MGIPNKELFQAAVDTALAEAELIALKVMTNPDLYIRPEIGNWGTKYVASRYNNVFNESDRGKLDLMEQEASSQVKQDLPGISLSAPTPEQLKAVGDGNAENSDAVVKQIAHIRGVLGGNAINELYGDYAKAVAAKDIPMGKALFINVWRAALLEFTKLYNTMLGNMKQGAKPKPVPGPGQHLEQVPPFGDWVVKDDPPLIMPPDTMLVGLITVGQLKLILGK
jgi:hypothetical protein